MAINSPVQRLGYRPLRITGIILVFIGFIAFWVLRPLAETDFSTPGFTPLKDDTLAARFVPLLIAHPTYGGPTRMLYRMARSSDGEVHIAYHPFYVNEENPHSGFGAWLSRIIYTGGWGLKYRMFGPADIELIEVVLDKSGTVKIISYEDAKSYNPKAFSVQHLPMTQIKPTQPFCFEVKTWNHMVALRDASRCLGLRALPVEYFSEAEWVAFKMTKKTEAILRRNRVHKVYERKAAY